jgi:hypothetical protein
MRICTVDDCESTALARGWCRNHYYRWSRHGSTDAKKHANGVIVDQLHHGVQANGPGQCVIVTTITGTRPCTSIDGFHGHASRAVWILANGDPGGLHVLHTCGRGEDGCIRLGHLYLGTAADNIRDQARDGSRAAGTRHGNAKLTTTDVAAIRSSGDTNQELAARYGVSPSHVSNVRHRKTWNRTPAVPQTLS